jgi:hypothetical protein
MRMHDRSLSNLALGFVAAALAVVTAHQLIVLILTQLKVINGTPWSFASVPPFGVPQIINGMFWGGLWGVLYAAIQHRLPGGADWLKGLVYGWLVLLFSNWLLLPFIKGTLLGQKNQAFFAGGDPTRLMAGALILGGFGIALAQIYRLLSDRH